jgi:hypothetical protein
MRALVAAWAILTVTTAPAPGLRDRTDDERTRRLGAARLEGPAGPVSLGGTADCVVLFDGYKSGYPAFNLWFKPGLPWPARVVVFDRDLKPVGEFVSLPPDAEATAADWMRVPGGRFVGARLRLPIGPADDPRGVRYVGKPWEAGSYHLQAIYTRRFWAAQPRQGRTLKGDGPLGAGPFPDTPVRSDLVPLEVIPPAEAALPARRPPVEAPRFPLPPGRPLLGPAYRLRATLRGEGQPVEALKGFTVVFRYESLSDREQTFHDDFVLLPGLYPRPMRLGVFRGDGGYVGDLLASDVGFSTVMRERKGWDFKLPPGGVCGYRMEVTNAGIVPGTEFTNRRPLPPGEYALQAVYDREYFAESPLPADSPYVSGGNLTVPHPEPIGDPAAFRTNPVRLVLTESTKWLGPP